MVTIKQYYEMTPVEHASKTEAIIEDIPRKRGKTPDNEEYILTPVRPLSFTQMLPVCATNLFRGALYDN